MPLGVSVPLSITTILVFTPVLLSLFLKEFSGSFSLTPPTSSSHVRKASAFFAELKNGLSLIIATILPPGFSISYACFTWSISCNFSNGGFIMILSYFLFVVRKSSPTTLCPFSFKSSARLSLISATSKALSGYCVLISSAILPFPADGSRTVSPFLISASSSIFSTMFFGVGKNPSIFEFASSISFCFIAFFRSASSSVPGIFSTNSRRYARNSALFSIPMRFNRFNSLTPSFQ